MLETPSIRRYSFMVTPSCEAASVSSENPTGADNQQETARSNARTRSELGGGLRRRRRVLLGLGAPQSQCAAYRWLAAPSRLPRLSTPGSSRCARGTRHVLRNRPASAQGTAEQRVDLRGRLARRARGSSAALLRVPPVAGEGSRLPTLRRHRAGDASEGASGTCRLRAPCAGRLFDEREWEATISHDRRNTCRILRDCTPGTAGTDAGPAMVKIQSDPH